MFTRRRILQAGIAASLAASVPGQRFIRSAYGTPLALFLSDPALQPKFVNAVPDALAPGFIYRPNRRTGDYAVSVAKATQATGLIDPMTGKALKTPVWGYGDVRDGIHTWPGRTFQVQSASAGGPAETVVNWFNGLRPVDAHLLPVDTTLHWAYSPHDDTDYSIAENGVPIITHLHGGHTDFQFDGNPEFFYGTEGRNQVIGPQWDSVPGGFTTRFRYDNDVPAGNLWYHDHALGITRLNVYAGMAGFYFVRDLFDTGIRADRRRGGNQLGLPAWPYEKAYAIQDRMFRTNGRLFYPAFPGDPFYEDFITGEGAELPPDIFPGGGPTALAEFFGDHMVVNGILWPKEVVEPRNYRLHVLNGTDSRFMVIRFRAVPAGATDLSDAGDPIPFFVIGADQGLASSAAQLDTLVSEPGGRYDIVFDFSSLEGQRIIMENIGGDAPFGGDFGDALDPDDLFPDRQTDRIMAFDVVLPKDNRVPDTWSPQGFYDATRNPNNTADSTTRRVALFEGTDEFGRLQPLLGTVDALGNRAQSATAYTWFQETTETPALDDTEDWEIYNFTGDAHPVHLHLVHFETLGRNEISFEEDGTVPVLQHNEEYGEVAKITNIEIGDSVDLGPADGYVDTTRRDMVTALPGQMTKIRATFDKAGRYVWHCHILSHEDHEMMRVLQVGS